MCVHTWYILHVKAVVFWDVTVQPGIGTKNLEHTAQPASSTPTMEAAGSCEMLVLVCHLIIGNHVN
jgi:hypothetical protein